MRWSTYRFGNFWKKVVRVIDVDGLSKANLTPPDLLNSSSLNIQAARNQRWRYLVAVLTVVAALAVESLFLHLFRDHVFLLFWAVIAFNAWYGGIGAGITASVLSVLVVDYFLEVPLYELNFPPVELAAVGVGLFITLVVNIPSKPRRELQQALQKMYAAAESERRRVSDILSSISDAYLALDAEYLFTDLNPQGEALITRLSGRPRADLIGKTVWEVFPDWASNEWGTAFRAALEQQTPTHIEKPVFGLDAWYEVHIYPFPAGLNIYLHDITARKQNETALRENEERFRRVLENMPVLLSVQNASGQTVFWNKEAERVTGYSAEEMLSIPSIKDQMFPDPAYWAEIDRYRKERRGDWRNLELTTRCKDGSTRIISWSNISRHYSIPGWDDWALGVDVTEQRRAAERLRVLQSITAALSRALTPEAVAGVIVGQVVDALDGLVASVVCVSEDSAHAELLNHRGIPEDLLESYKRFSLDAPLPMAEAIRHDEIIWLESMDAYQARYPQFFSKVQPRTGSQALLALPLKVDGKVIGAMGITFPRPRPRTDDDLNFMLALASQCAQALARARLYLTESHTRATAESANTSKLLFLGMIAHELRTPLSSIKGFATTLLAEDVEFDLSSQREFLGVIDQETDRLTDLIEQLLDLSRLQASSMRINLETESFQDILEAAMPNLKTLTGHHEWVMEIEPDIPPVLADARRIAQVLTNLVGNAARYSPPFTTITLRARCVGKMLQVDVADQGPGIPPEAHQRVFEAFRQGDGELEGRGPGAGLGLAICKGLVEAHGGKIWIHDQLPPGTTVSFTLPFAE